MTTKKIKTSDILGDNYYIYELTSSNYTPALNDTITITCTMKDVYGAAAGSKSITLYQNGTSVSVKTTNSSGVATWSVTCSNAGIQSFKVGNKTIEVFVDNKEDKSNKVTSISSSSTDTQYPSAKAVKDNLDLKVNKQEDSLITVTNGNIILSEYHTKDRWTNDGANGGNITSTTLTSGSQGNAFYVYNFPSSVKSVTIQFLCNTNGSYVSNSGGADSTPIDTSQNGTTFTATSDDGLCIEIRSANTQVTYTVTSITFNMNNWIDKIYPLGATYISTVEIEPSTLFGGVWERIKDRFLLGSGDTYANASTGGEATHTLTTNEMPSHTHTQNSHNHTQNSHNHTQNSHNHALTGSKSVGLQEGSKLRVGYGSASDSKNTNNATATNKATTATNQSATATNQNTGGGKAHNNMPPYLVVYMWKRIA